MQNSMLMLTFFIFDQKYRFLSKFAPKNQNCQYAGFNDDIYFTAFVWKYSFWKNLICSEKSKLFVKGEN